MAPDRVGTGGRGQHSTSDTGTAVVDVIAETLATVARDLEEHDDPDSMLAAIVAAAAAMVPGTEEGSISVVFDRRWVMSKAPTSDLPARSTTCRKRCSRDPAWTRSTSTRRPDH